MSIGDVFAWWKEAGSAIVLAGGVFVAVPDDYYPAHRGWVQASNAEIKRGLGNLQLQGMQARRDLLRKNEFELHERQTKEPTAERHQQIQSIKDTLEELDREIRATRDSIPK